jgi:DDE superfamily endonuclease
MWFVKTTKPEAAAAVRIGARLAVRKRGELLDMLRPCFARPEPWLQARKYLSALASGLTRRNGWTIAERAGDETPDKTQRLLNRAVWDTAAATGVIRRFAVAGLQQPGRRSGRRGGLVIGAMDETGQEKTGTATAGVQRQYLGCAGKVANGINTVHLAYVREGAGHALIGARQWIPAAQIDDPARSRAMGLPPDLEFRTKGQLAIDIAAEALADGIAFDFFCGDEVYGSCTELREFLQARGQAYVLRVARNFRPVPAGRAAVNLRGRRAAGCRQSLRGPLGRDGSPGPALVRLVLAGHRLPAAPPAHPPPPQNRRTGVSLLLRPRRAAGDTDPADQGSRTALAGRRAVPGRQGLPRPG